MEFSDKPQIYNEFLEIMKNFKAQTINTPGVIDAVKNLFKGYNKLILGFNTFLPEGEGFKIELTEEEENTPYPGNNPNYHTSGVGGSSSSTDAAAGSGTMMTPNQGQGAGEAATGQQMMQQQHAISYVTTIRNRFANEPDTYRAFLRILHTYQKEQKGIKDVLEQVSILFADHPDLLMEFTYFLPDAVQDQAKERLNRAARESEMRRRQRERDKQRRQHELAPGHEEGSKSLAALLICGVTLFSFIYATEIASFYSSYGTPILCFSSALSSALCLEIFYHKSVFGIKVRN